jgi:hypothetical protein
VRADIHRDYYWDGPLCWLSGRRLAVWGVGNDDYSLLPAVRVIDVTNGEESSPIIGPFGPAETALTLKSAGKHWNLAERGVLEFDQYLFAWSPAAGFSAWDVVHPARVFEAKGFCPLAYNRGSGELFSQDADGTYLVSKLMTE